MLERRRRITNVTLAAATTGDRCSRTCPHTRRLEVSWATVALLTIVIAVVDGFWVTSLHGAVGDVASGQDQFHRWLRDSTMMLPSLALSVLAALALSRRLARWSWHGIVRLAAAAVLIIAISTAVGIAEATVSAAADYATQANELTHVHSIHTTTVAAAPATADANNPTALTALNAARRSTLTAHVRGLKKVSVLLLVTNMVLVLWVLAVRAGRLWLPTTSDASTSSTLDRRVPVRVAVAVACLLGAQFLHWHVIDQHAQEWRASGVFFFVLALCEGALAILVVARPHPSVAAAAIFISVVPVMVWAWDRTLGLPFGPTAGIRGTVGRSDVMSVLFELITIGALWPFLRRTGDTNGRARVDAIGRIVIGATCAYVAAFSVWAMLGDQTAVHHVTQGTSPGVAVPSPTPTNGAPLNFIPEVAPSPP